MSPAERREAEREAKWRASREKGAARCRANAEPRTLEELKRELRDIGTRLGWWARRHQREDVDQLGGLIGYCIAGELSEARDVDFPAIGRSAVGRVESVRFNEACRARTKAIMAARRSPNVVDLAAERAKREA